MAPSTRAGGMSVEYRLELWAESMAPSRIWAQFASTWTFTMETRAVGVGANAGASNFSGTKSPASRALLLAS